MLGKPALETFYRQSLLSFCFFRKRFLQLFLELFQAFVLSDKRLLLAERNRLELFNKLIKRKLFIEQVAATSECGVRSHLFKESTAVEFVPRARAVVSVYREIVKHLSKRLVISVARGAHSMCLSKIVHHSQDS